MTASLDFLTPNLAQGVGKVLVQGDKVHKNIAEAIISSDLSMSTSEITQLTVVLHDTDLDILRSGLFAKYTPIDYEDLKLEVTNINTEPGASGRGQLTIKARALVVGKLKRRKGVFIMRKASPSQFVVAECKAVGAPYMVQPSPRRGVVKRDVKRKGESFGNDQPSSWSTFQRLSEELGYICFEAGNVVYFGQPSWLIKQPLAKIPVRWGSGDKAEWADALPNFTYSADSEEGPFGVSFNVPLSRAHLFRPGRMARMLGIPFFKGDYLINTVDYALTNSGSVNVQASSVVDPEPVERATFATAAGAGAGLGAANQSLLDGDYIPSTGNRGTKLASDFVYWALMQAGDTYIWGAQPSRTEQDPDAFDCSGLVAWACGQTGVPFVGGSQIQRTDVWTKTISVEAAIGIRGALLFNDTHVAISLGTGRTIEAVNREYGVREMEARGRTAGWEEGGLIRGLRYA